MLRISARRHRGGSRRRIFRRGGAQHAGALVGEFHFGRPVAHRAHGAGGGSQDIPYGQHHPLRRRDGRHVRRDRPRGRRGRRRGHRVRHRGHTLCPPHGHGGAYLDAVQHIELRGGEVLLAVGRRGGAGARTEPRTDRTHLARDRAERHNGPQGRACADRDVRPRRVVHVGVGQMLPERARGGLLGQPRRVPTDLPPQIHHYRHAVGARTGRRRTLRPIAQGSVHYRLSRPLHRGRRAGAQDRGARARRGVREASGGELRCGPARHGARRIYPRVRGVAERAARHGLQPRFLGGLLCGASDGGA